MAFDINAARKAGYSDSEIAEGLANKLGVDYESARRDGYSDQDILSGLIPKIDAAYSSRSPRQQFIDAESANSDTAKSMYAGNVDDVSFPETSQSTMGIASEGDKQTAKTARKFVEESPNLVRSAPGLIKAGLVKSVAGGARFLGEDTTGDESSIYGEDAVRPGFGTFGNPQELAKWGTDTAEEASQLEQETKAKYPVTTGPGQTVQNTLTSIGQQAPGIALAAVGMPGVGLPLMAAQTFGQTYAESRAKGVSPVDAMNNAAIQGGAEWGTEILPFTMIAKGMKQGISRSVLRNYLLGEQLGEHFATAIQNSSDVYFNEKDPTKRTDKAIDYFLSKKHWTEDQVDTFWQTLLQSAIMAGGGKVLNTAKNKLTGTAEMTPEQTEAYEAAQKQQQSDADFEHHYGRPFDTTAPRETITPQPEVKPEPKTEDVAVPDTFIGNPDATLDDAIKAAEESVSEVSIWEKEISDYSEQSDIPTPEEILNGSVSAVSKEAEQPQEMSPVRGEDVDPKVSFMETLGKQLKGTEAEGGESTFNSAEFSRKVVAADSVKAGVPSSQETVKKWEGRIAAGERPEVLTQSQNGESHVVDGEHKLQAYKNLGITDIPTIDAKSPDIAEVTNHLEVLPIDDEKVKDYQAKLQKAIDTGNTVVADNMRMFIEGNRQRIAETSSKEQANDQMQEGVRGRQEEVAEEPAAIKTDLSPVQQEFVQNRVKNLGSLEAVQSAYPNQDAAVDRYAREFASQSFQRGDAIEQAVTDYDRAHDELDAITPTIQPLTKAVQNHVVMDVQGMDGNAKGKISAPYDGTREDAVRVAKALKLHAAENMNASMKESAVFAVNKDSEPVYEFTQGAGVTEVHDLPVKETNPAAEQVQADIPVSSKAKTVGSTPWLDTKKGDIITSKGKNGKPVTSEVLTDPDANGFFSVKVIDPNRTGLKAGQVLNQHRQNIKSVTPSDVPSVQPESSAVAGQPAAAPATSSNVITMKDGAPFKSENGARMQLKLKKLSATHEVKPVQGGFVVAPKGEAVSRNNGDVVYEEKGYKIKVDDNENGEGYVVEHPDGKAYLATVSLDSAKKHVAEKIKNPTTATSTTVLQQEKEAQDKAIGVVFAAQQDMPGQTGNKGTYADRNNIIAAIERAKAAGVEVSYKTPATQFDTETWTLKDASGQIFKLHREGTGRTTWFQESTKPESYIDMNRRMEGKAPMAEVEKTAKGEEPKRLVSDARAEELKKRLREKLNGAQLNSGIDPEILAIGAELAVYHIETGARTFAAFAKKMVADIGDNIKPYLKMMYNAVRDFPGAEHLERDMDEYAAVKKADIEEALKAEEKPVETPAKKTGYTYPDQRPVLTEERMLSEIVPADYMDLVKDAALLPFTHLINTPEREALRVEKAEELYKGGAKNKNFRADLILGLASSGKSGVADPMAIEHGSIVLDSDDAKKLLPEFKNGYGANAVHEESSDIFDRALERALLAGDNIVLPLVGGKLSSLEKRLKILTDAGYDIHLHFADLAMEKAVGRLINRFNEEGRLLDPRLITDNALHPWTNYNIVKAKGGIPDETRQEGADRSAQRVQGRIEGLDGLDRGAVSGPDDKKNVSKTGGAQESSSEYRIESATLYDNDKAIEDPTIIVESFKNPTPIPEHVHKIRVEIRAAAAVPEKAELKAKPAQSTTEDPATIWQNLPREKRQDYLEAIDSETKPGKPWKFIPAAEKALLLKEMGVTTNVSITGNESTRTGGDEGTAGNVGTVSDQTGNEPAGNVATERPGKVQELVSEGDTGTALNDGYDAAESSGSGSGSTVSTSRRARTDAGSGTAPVTTGSTRNFTITNELDFAGQGAKTKFRNNVEAIKLLKKLEDESRLATSEEQSILARYVGWGGLHQAFDSKKKDWSKEYTELKDLLTPEQYETAVSSTRNAHYTAAEVVKSLWSIANRLGFQRGSILEPSMGTGNFFGLMPRELRSQSKLTGVEFDHITGSIAKHLYPQARIHAPMGFQDIKLVDNSFDLGIGNPPFGSESLYDSDNKDISKFKIHGFFFAKQLKAIRPGGILVNVVSKGLLDANDATAQKTREWLSKRARLVGAIRLPDSAFKANAGTDVTTDIVILQKLAPGEQGNVAEWNTIETIKDRETGGDIRLNKYFVDHPEMLMGEMTLQGKMKRGMGETLTARPGDDLPAMLQAAIESLPQGIVTTGAKTTTELIANPKAGLAKVHEVRPYNYYVEDGKIFQRLPDLNGEAVTLPVKAEGAVKERLTQLIEIRDAVRRQLLLESSPNSATNDTLIEQNRKRLNNIYDAFVKKYGYINTPYTKRLIWEDADSPLLRSLEKDFDKGVSKASAKTQGVEPREPSAKKSAIFEKRVLSPATEVTSVATADEALMAAINERGRVDFNYMRGIYKPEGKEVSDAQLIKELGDRIFEDPRDGWVAKSEYLSGNVKAKLVEAEQSAKEDPRYNRNVKALEEVQPEDVAAADIYVAPHAFWLTEDVFQQFAADVLKGTMRGGYSRATAKWNVQFTSSDSTINSSKYGTARVSATSLMATMMANQQIAVYDSVPDGKGGTMRAFNATETAAAQGKADELLEAFQDWIWKDADRRNKLVARYNDLLNTDVDRKFDGAHLTLPGLAPNFIFRPHQKNVVFRSVQKGVVLLDHVVGSGKTAIITATSQELRRLGMARKPMITVPNHLVEQWSASYSRLYPNAKILAATKKDFTKENRKLLFAKIATGDWDAVIVAHSSFKFIPVPSAIEAEILNEQKAEIITAIREAKEDSGKGFTVKDLERAKEKIENKLKALADMQKDDLLDFEEMGIDALFVDEAHEFKNLFYTTTMQNVAGLGNQSGSGRAFDMFVKTQYLMRRNGGKGVYFATGTPVSNSLAEVFHMQRFLQYDELKARGVHQFDAWASAFGQATSDWEQDAGGRYKQKTRFRKLVNLPELKQLWGNVTDTVTNNDIIRDMEAQGKKFPLPKIEGGKPTNVVTERSPQQAEYIGVPQEVKDEEGNTVINTETGQPFTEYLPGTIVYRMENWAQAVKEGNTREIPLVITGDARKAGLDFRLIDESSPDFAGSKVNTAVNEIFDIYKENDHRKGTQLVFIDLSTPKAHKGKATEKLAAKTPTYFVTEGVTRQYVDGQWTRVWQLQHVAGKPIDLGVDGIDFFSFKKGKVTRIYESQSGTVIGEGSTLADAKEAALSRLSVVGEDVWKTRAAEQAIPSDQIDGYIERWEEAQRSAEDNSEDEKESGEEEISFDDLLADSGKSTFSVYDDIKKKLIAKGIRPDQIAFIHDANTDDQKRDLFAKVNQGIVRVLLGSTQKMGAGTNVQKKLVGLHHLDAPWKPSDLAQREGRIVRQGNEFYNEDPDNFVVKIRRYATKQTYDSRMWEIIETKAKSIELFKTGGKDLREIEDVSSESANAAEIKASSAGNPLMLEDLQLRNEIKKYEAQEKSWRRSRYDLEDKIASVENRSAWPYKNLAEKEALRKGIQPKNSEALGLVLGKLKINTKEDMNTGDMFQALDDGLAKSRKQEGGLVDVGSYRGATIKIGEMINGLTIALHTNGKEIGNTVYWKDDKFSAPGFMTRIDNILDSNLLNSIQMSKESIARLEREAVSAREELKQPFKHADILKGLRDKHKLVIDALRKGKTSIDEEKSVALSIGEKTAQGIDAYEARNFITALLTRWGNAPAVKVVQSESDLPPRVVNQINSVGAQGEVQGAFYNGNIYIVADNLDTVDHSETVFVHEAVGHYGLKGILGEKYNQTMNQIVMSVGRSGLQDIAKQYNLDLNDQADRFTAAEELLASWAEKGERPTLVNKVIAVVREWLRNMGLKVKWSDNDIRNLLAKSRQWVKESKEEPVIWDGVNFMKAKFSRRPAGEKFRSASDDVQKRRDAAHGLEKGPGLIDKIKDVITQTIKETQHFPELDQKRDAQTADILRVFESSREAAIAKTVAYLKQLTGKMSPEEMNNFEWRILLDDLMSEAAKGHALPFGYTAETLAEDHARIIELTDNDEKVRAALELRREKQREVVSEMVESGLLPESVLENENYFRHMVLEYANAKKWAGLSNSDVRNKKRGWMKQRQGSELDINTNFLEAEFEVYSQQLKELAAKETLDKVEDLNDVSRKLKRQARNTNFENLVGGPDNVRRIRLLEGQLAELREGEIDGGVKAQMAAITEELDSLDPTRPFKKAMAMGFGKLSRMAQRGELPRGNNGNTRDMAQAIASGEPDEKMFNYIAELASNSDDAIALPARQILKAIADMDKMYRSVLGSGYLEYRRAIDERLIPEGYVEWQPVQGNVFMRQTTLPEEIINKAISATWSVEDLMNSGLLKSAVVIGGKRRSLVIPEGVALTLDNIRMNRDTAVLDTINKKMIGTWKIWTLLSPRRVIKYNLNNMSGDLDAALAADPVIVKYMKDAWQAALARRKGVLSALDKEMLDRGVLSSGISINEIPDINQLPFFRGITDEQRNAKLWEALKSGNLESLAPNALIAKYFDKVSDLTNIREGLLREAAYRRALELLREGKPVMWASKPDELNSIPDIKDKAAKLSRELLGDYGNLSATGEQIRARYIPFWSWMEINAPRYYRIFKNAAQEGGKFSAGARITGVAGKKFIGTTAGVLEKVVLTQMLFAAVSAFNHLVWGGDDDELDAKQLHIILGKTTDGKILSVRFQGAFSDALAWFGLEDYPKSIAKLQDGSMSAGELARKMVMATPNKIANSAMPFVKLAGEVMMGKTIYPDITRPRPIRDKVEHVARTFSLDNEYKALAGKPSKGYLSSLSGTLIYANNPKEQAYNEVKELAVEWMKKQGKEMPSGEPTRRSNALYYYKQALRFEDHEAAAKYKAIYKEEGGTNQGMATSIRNAHPLHTVGAHQVKFKRSLTPGDLKKVDMAVEYYKDIYRR